MMVLVSFGLISCDKTPEQMILGVWKVDSAMLTQTDSNGTVTSDMPGFDDYWYEFEKSGLCTVTDRTITSHYDWYLLDDKSLILTDYVNNSYQYDLVELQPKRMVLTYEYGYKEGPDSIYVRAEQRFELSKR